jgi:2'-5' RNA ligase
MASLRLFIAIEIPNDIKAQIAEVVQKLRSIPADVKWEHTDKLHITLKFLGDTNADLLPQINTTLQRCAETAMPFIVSYEALGCFPSKREPKIIWIGVQDRSSLLHNLAGSLDTALTLVGFKREERRFHAHVTIGRVKSQRNVKDLLRTMESTTLVCQPTEVSQIVLIKSELKPHGSEYARIKTFAFHA